MKCLLDIEKNIVNFSQKLEMVKLQLKIYKVGLLLLLMEGQGSMLSTPILNPPQSAVLGMHNIVQRPVEVEEMLRRPCILLYLLIIELLLKRLCPF